MEALWQSSRNASIFSIHNLISYATSVHPLARSTFSRGLAEQGALDGSRHFLTSFLPVDALDGSFSAGRLSGESPIREHVVKEGFCGPGS